MTLNIPGVLSSFSYEVCLSLEIRLSRGPSTVCPMSQYLTVECWIFSDVVGAVKSEEEVCTGKARIRYSCWMHCFSMLEGECTPLVCLLSSWN